jgi:hypothetical protein
VVKYIKLIGGAIMGGIFTVGGTLTYKYGTNSSDCGGWTYTRFYNYDYTGDSPLFKRTTPGVNELGNFPKKEEGEVE